MIESMIINEIRNLEKLYPIEFLKIFFSVKNNKASLNVYFISGSRVFKLSKDFILDTNIDVKSLFETIKREFLPEIEQNVLRESRLRGLITRTYNIEEKNIGKNIVLVFNLYPSQVRVFNAFVGFVSDDNDYMEISIRKRNYEFT